MKINSNLLDFLASSVILMLIIFVFCACAKSEDETKIKYYIVKEGENLMRIASDIYGDSQYWIFVAKWNDFNEYNANNIRVGQKIKLINKGLTPKVHKVEEGENFSVISKEYSVTINCLEKWNNIKGGLIHINQDIIVGWRMPFVRAVFENKTLKFIFKLMIAVVVFLILNEIFKWFDTEFEGVFHERISGFVFSILICFYTWGIGFFFELGDNLTDVSSLVAGFLSLIYKYFFNST